MKNKVRISIVIGISVFIITSVLIITYNYGPSGLQLTLDFILNKIYQNESKIVIDEYGIPTLSSTAYPRAQTSPAPRHLHLGLMATTSTSLAQPLSRQSQT